RWITGHPGDVPGYAWNDGDPPANRNASERIGYSWVGDDIHRRGSAALVDEVSRPMAQDGVEKSIVAGFGEVVGDRRRHGVTNVSQRISAERRGEAREEGLVLIKRMRPRITRQRLQAV